MDFTQGRLTNLLLAQNVFLRHDVDYDPHCAVAMATKEKKLGVKSTFFIRRLEEYDNPSEALAYFTEVSEMGHELAPHVDLMMGRKAKVPNDYLMMCCEQDFLQLSLSLPVTRKVSFHAPPADALWRSVEGFEHAMTPYWCGRYVADSRGVFRRNPEQALQTVTIGRPLQLNLHPEWWFWPGLKCDEWRLIEAAKP